MKEDARVRVRVLYRGHVQGVGFRRRAERAAHGLALEGFVRNLPDGRVELAAEGQRVRVDRLLAAIRGDMGDLIEGEELSSSAPEGGLGAFHVAR